MQQQIKKSWLLGVGLLGLAAAPQVTQATELTANAGLTSNYVFRGLTQTDDGIAVQGGVDYIHDLGFYAGAWASNVELTAGDKGYETDLYAGYNFKLNEDIIFDVGYITYLYTSVNGDPDASEIYFGGSYKEFSLTYYLGDRDNGADYSYIDFKYTMVLPQDYNLHLHAGTMDDDAANSDYHDIAAGVSKEFGGFNIGLTVTSIVDHDDSTMEDTEIFISATKAFNIM